MRNLISAMKSGWRHLKVPCVLYTCTSILTLTRRQKSTCALYTSEHYTRDFTVIKGDMFVMIYVLYGRPNDWTDRDETWHTHSCPPRECFWQGQCQGHSCMCAWLTEVRNTRKATPGKRCSNYVRTTGEATPSERLWNSVRRTGN